MRTRDGAPDWGRCGAGITRRSPRRSPRLERRPCTGRTSWRGHPDWPKPRLSSWGRCVTSCARDGRPAATPTPAHARAGAPAGSGPHGRAHPLSGQLAWLVDDLLDFSRIERGELVVLSEDLDVVPVLQEVVAGFRHRPDTVGCASTCRSPCRRTPIPSAWPRGRPTSWPTPSRTPPGLDHPAGAGRRHDLYG